MKRAYRFLLFSQRCWGPVSGAVSCLLFVRIDTDTYDDSATAMETATATAATTRTDISQSPSSPFLHPVPDAPVLPWCVHQQRLLCFCFCFASAVALPIWFVCSLVRLLLRTSTCFRCEPLPLPLPLSLPLALALAVLGQRLWAQQSEILVRMYRQAGRQQPYKRISQNWSNSIVRYAVSVRSEVVALENIKQPKGIMQIRYAT